MQNYESTEIKFVPPSPVIDRAVDPVPSPDNPPWGVGIAIVTWVVSVLAIIIIPTIAVIAYALSAHLNVTSPDFAKTAGENPAIIIANIIAVFPAHLLTILVAWLVVTRGAKYSFAEMIGVKSGGFKTWHVLVIVATFFVAATALIRVFGDPDNQLTMMLKTSVYAVYIVAFLATVTAPLVEEVVYRGVLYSAFQRTIGVPMAVAIVTLLFLAVHVPQYWGSTATLIMIGLLSLTLTLIRVKTKNLIPCIILHTVLNGIQSVALVASTFFPEETQKATEQVGLFLRMM